MTHLDDEDAWVVVVAEDDETTVITEAANNPVPQQTKDYAVVSTDNVPYIPVPGGPGDPGPDGPSAYEVWIAQGNVGTEQDFLDSLIGPQGPSGNADAAYVHDQVFSSDTWTIVHNLGFRPNVSIFDSGGSEVEGDIEHVDINTMILTFNAAFGGKAYLS